MALYFISKCSKYICFANKIRLIPKHVYGNETKCLKHTWTVKVGPFWKLQAQLNNCNVKIDSCYPSGNLDGDTLTIETDLDVKDGNKSLLQVESNKDVKCVYVTNTKSNFLRNFHIFTPPAFDIDVCGNENSSISISNLESHTLHANADFGNISLNNIKAQDIVSRSKHGNITSSKVLQGNVCLKAVSIVAEKIQSPRADIHVDDGSLLLSDVYTSKFIARNENGDIRIQSLHGCADIKTTKGDILVGTVEGNFTGVTESGDINVHIATADPVNIWSNNGEVSISLDKTLGVGLDLEAEDVILNNTKLDNEQKSSKNKNNNVTGVVNGGGPLIKAVAKVNNVTVTSSSWIERIANFRKQVKKLRGS